MKCPNLTVTILIDILVSDHQEYVQISINDTDISKKLNISLPVSFIIHGWFDSAHRTWVKSTVAGTG